MCLRKIRTWFWRWRTERKIKKIRNKKNIWFNDFYIKSPDGRKALIFAVNAYASDHRKWGILAENKRNEQWYGQLVDAAASVGVCDVFIEEKFNPEDFLKKIKERGFKVYWT